MVPRTTIGVPRGMVSNTHFALVRLMLMQPWLALLTPCCATDHGAPWMKIRPVHADRVLDIGAVALGESIGTPYVDESMYISRCFSLVWYVPLGVGCWLVPIEIGIDRLYSPSFHQKMVWLASSARATQPVLLETAGIAGTVTPLSVSGAGWGFGFGLASASTGPRHRGCRSAGGRNDGDGRGVGRRGQRQTDGDSARTCDDDALGGHPPSMLGGAKHCLVSFTVVVWDERKFEHFYVVTTPRNVVCGANPLDNLIVNRCTIVSFGPLKTAVNRTPD